MTSPIDTARKLRREAEDLLFVRGVEPLLKQHGKVVYTGSYELDLMAWCDIDLNLIISDEKDRISSASFLASEFVKWEEIIRVKFEKNLHKKYPVLPKGLYLGVKLNIGEWKLPWKLDIWIVDEIEAAKTQKTTNDIKKMLTPANRETILKWKQKLMTKEGRTPSFSGYWIYQAILVHNLKEEKEILEFLREKCISV